VIKFGHLYWDVDVEFSIFSSNSDSLSSLSYSFSLLCIRYTFFLYIINYLISFLFENSSKSLNPNCLTALSVNIDGVDVDNHNVHLGQE